LKREKSMEKTLKEQKPAKPVKFGVMCLFLLLMVVTSNISAPVVQAAGATTSVHIVKYADDGTKILAEKTVTYQWMEQNLPVQGDGITHYYHQGPIFEGDIWDPDEISNLKDKGAVEGTDIKDLCNLVGGMSPGDEVMILAVDGWHTEFAYSNIYEPSDRQGIIALCWYNGGYSQEGDSSGVGYPANNAYNSAIQIVFMAKTTNRDGKHVFGNSDMKAALPEGKYQHFYEGKYPSTSGLSGKWISEIRIYNGGIKPGIKIDLEANQGATETTKSIPWLAIILGAAGLLLICLTIYLQRKKRTT